MQVIVLGAGVIGLTAALRLREAGHDVRVWTRDPPEDTTSAVAAALWYPYLALPRGEVTRWAAVSYQVFARLVRDPDSGVALRSGRELFRATQPDPWWAGAVPDLVRCTGDDLPAGFADGWRFTAPVVDMGDYLPWLVDRLAALGSPVVQRAVTRLGEPLEHAEVVVNATGLGARELVGDPTLRPVRGQVVRVADPGLTGWLIDAGNPDGMVYVIPRGRDVVCGGTEAQDSPDLTVDPATAAAILARCRALVPELAEAPVVSHAVGLRPARPEVRLERAGRVVHCYGHGGAGVTVSWGCAADVAALVGPAGSRRS